MRITEDLRRHANEMAGLVQVEMEVAASH